MWPCGHGSTQSAAPCTGQFGSQTKSGPVCGGQVQSCAMASGLPGLGSIRRSLLIRFTLAFSRLTYCRRSSPAGHSISGTTASIEQSRLLIPAATAGEVRRVLWMRSYIQTEAPTRCSRRVDRLAGDPHSLSLSCSMPSGPVWPDRRGKRSGDDAQSRHDQPALGSGARDRVAGGTATTIRFAPLLPFSAIHRTGE